MLTDTAVRNAKPKAKAYKVSDSLGLYLLVNPKGSKLWRLKYRMNGVERKLAIGPYPQFTLSEARAARDAARRQVAHAIDPNYAKRQARIEASLADDADRATGSVLFMLAKAADLIQFLRTDDSGGTPFAFRDFIHGLDKRKGAKPWIFVPRKEDYFEASKPLLACWLECAASAVLGLPPSPDRRIWFVLDELADLPRVDNLARLLPEGRKFGAAVVLTFQALGQMQHRYGPKIAEAMLGCCNTKLLLQTIDSETRVWASQTIGECEVEIQTMTDALADGDDIP